MKNRLTILTAGMFLAMAGSALAAVRYVDMNSSSPAPPYTSWATAARVIQEAVDASAPGDEIVVTNGTYATGGRAVVGTMTNRVTVDKPMILRSANGPQFTIIQGWQVSGITNGDGAIRCVYLTNGASLSGFTLTNGATLGDRDRDYFVEKSGGGLWCESATAVVSNCVVAGNSAAGSGGGAYSGTLYNCTFTGNSAHNGAGASRSTLNNCMFSGNSARRGGFFGFSYGGGAIGSTLNNCTLIGNYADIGGGAAESTLNNCIIYFNSAAQGANYDVDCSLNYSCTTPLPPAGTGNIAVDPQLANASHLSAASPCRGTGSTTDASGTDIDGEAWASPPSIGCDEYHAEALTGPLSVGIDAPFTSVATGYPLGLTALIDGRTTASVWDFGDGLMATSLPYATHAWNASGDYAVVLRAYNESQPAGISATVTVQVVTQPIHYVSAESGNPIAPYTTWATAATKIQDALDVAGAPGALVLVTNGTYAAGGRAVAGTLVNRVAVDKPLTLRSVNGPLFTIIEGRQLPGTITGDGAIRCVYLGPGASLSGFTLTNGATRSAWDDDRESSGGGLWCESSAEVVSNCVLTGNSAAGSGGGAAYATLNNCVFTGNSAHNGGGAFFGTLNNCTLSGNSALEGCVVGASGSSCYVGSGGGAAYAVLNNCTLTGNSAPGGGGAYAGTLNNCTLSGNSAENGGGAWSSTLNNCTLTDNLASISGGGAANSTLYNCIVYFNSAAQGENYDGDCALNYSCTTPSPPAGTGNIGVDPQLANTSHLSAASPCRGAGNAAYASGADIDGEAWASPPSIGCDEYHPGALTGPLSVSITALLTNLAAGYPLGLTAVIEGRTTASVWEFGDGLAATNQLNANHIWTAPGDYAVLLRAYNESQPAGISSTVTVHVVMQPVHYVAANSANPVPPYTSWATAAANIQDGVDAARVSGALVLVTNGTYNTGGRAVIGTLINRVAVDKPLALQSVNGPQFTMIQGNQMSDTITGDGAIRCVYLGNGASLSGFTLTNGATRTAGDGGEQSGGGVWCESATAVVSNCVVAGNAAYSSGGGAYHGTLSHCRLSDNAAGGSGGRNPDGRGGGAYGAMLNNCALIDNSVFGFSGAGGGAYGGTLNNCTLTNNSTSYVGGGVYGATLNNCTLTGNLANRGFDALGGGAADCTLNNCTLSGNSSRRGGGADGGTLNNCTLTGNSAQTGGGASFGTLNNCTLTGNSAGNGGGVYYGTLNNCTLIGNSALSDGSGNGGFGGGVSGATLNNCIVYFNTAAQDANYDSSSSFNSCCTTPQPTNGIGNTTLPPLFLDQAGGNLRLQSNSPCINAGNNVNATGGTDLDGNPRIAGSTVDIGAYEFQTPASLISYAWLQQYGLLIDGSADNTDLDADGLNNWQEWRCGTDPTNSFSALRLLAPMIGGTNVAVDWQSVAGVSYFLERSTDLGVSPPLFAPLATNIPGQPNTTSYTDTNAVGVGRFFYRVGVQ